MIPDATDVAWAAGFFDGEGYIGVYRRSDRAAGRLRLVEEVMPYVPAES